MIQLVNPALEREKQLQALSKTFRSNEEPVVLGQAQAPAKNDTLKKVGGVKPTLNAIKKGKMMQRANQQKTHDGHCLPVFYL